jgi:hypothetical protein
VIANDDPHTQSYNKEENKGPISTNGIIAKNNINI